MTGGDVLEITYNHPTLGSGSFFPKSGEDNTLDPGGFRSNDDANSIAGSGEMIDQMNRVRWMFEGPIAWDTANNKELDKLKKLASSPEQATYTFQHISGKVYRGKGKPVGELKGNLNTATIPLKLSGGLELEEIG